MVITKDKTTGSSTEQEQKKDIFFLKGTKETPEVTLNKTEGLIKISGRSFPEDAKSFYKDIKKWLFDYSEHPKQGTHFVFMLEYFNTMSSKMILEIFNILKQIETKDELLRIDWHYCIDDDDMLEAGEDFAEIAEINVNFFSYE